MSDPINNLIGEVSGEQEMLGSLGMDVQLIYRGYQAYIDAMRVDTDSDSDTYGQLLVTLTNIIGETTTDIPIGRVKGEQGDTGYYFTPSVDTSGNISWTNNGDLSNPTTRNIKGPKGDTGDAAGFGTPTASVSGLAAGDSPTVSVTSSGSDTSKVFNFTFGIPQGNKGDKGDKGDTGNTGSAAGFDSPEISVSTLPAGSSATASISASGSDTNKKFTFTLGIPRGQDGTGVGDMLKSDYDTHSYVVGDAIAVDNSRNLDGHAASYFATSSHTHDYYSKPNGGIPSTDMDSSVQASLSKADTSIQTLPVASSSTAGITKVGASNEGAAAYNHTHNYYTKPANGIPSTDLDASVQSSLSKAESAIQTHQTLPTASSSIAGITKVGASNEGAAAYNHTHDYYSKPNDGIPISDLTSTVQGVLSALSEASGAGFHNSIYRGKSLGSTVTPEQYAAIANNTFDDLFVGDYWTKNINIDNVSTAINFYVADFNYMLNTGNGYIVSTPHIVIVPDKCFGSTVMYSSSAADQTLGYANATIRTGNRMINITNELTAAFKDASGNDHILSYYDTLSNATSNGKVTGFAEYLVKIELMSEAMVYGSQWFEAAATGGSDSDIPGTQYTKKTQLSPFRYRPDLITCRQSYWLQNPVSFNSNVNVPYASYARVGTSGRPYYYMATQNGGIRPYFLLY